MRPFSVLAILTLLTLPGLAPANAESLSILDGRGQTVTLDRPARSVVTIPIPSAAILMALHGGPEVIAAMHPASLAAIKGSILERIYPAAAQIRTDIIAGGTFNPNVETVLTLKPDAVVQWASQGPDLPPTPHARPRRAVQSQRE